MNNETFGAAVRQRRKQMGASLAVVASRMEISAAALSLLEKGASTWTFPRMLSAASALNSNLFELLGMSFTVAQRQAAA